MKRFLDVITIAGWRHNTAALFAVVLVLAGFANADAMFSAHSHKGKKGRLKITAPTEIGGVNLLPGDYEVKEVNSSDRHVVEFVRETYNLYAGEGSWPYEEEIVAQAEFNSQPLSSMPKHTQLLFAPNTLNPIGLEIRGSAMDYLFSSPQLSVQSGATMDCVSGGLHE